MMTKLFICAGQFGNELVQRSRLEVVHPGYRQRLVCLETRVVSRQGSVAGNYYYAAGGDA